MVKICTPSKIGRILLCHLFVIICGLSISHAADQNKAVVVPLLDSAPENLVERFVNVETSFTWDCPPAPNSLSLIAECPLNCIAVGGACSAKTVADATDVNVTGGNFIKTDGQLSKYNAYKCWIYALACRDPSNPPVGYAQVICFCDY